MRKKIKWQHMECAKYYHQNLLKAYGYGDTKYLVSLLPYEKFDKPKIPWNNKLMDWSLIVTRHEEPEH